MTVTIDTTSYDKHAKYPALDKDGIGRGYATRGSARPSALVIHSTNGVPGSLFASECFYLRDSPKVSAHFLVSKAGAVAQILDPKWEAWHAGKCQVAWENVRSIGIECHHAVGDGWPSAQRTALAWLVKKLMGDFGIALPMIETHGQIALPGPYDRKKDPSDWTHADFLAWRATLTAPTFPTLYRAKVSTAIWEKSDGTAPQAGVVLSGELVLLDAARYAQPTAHISKTSPSHPDLGFVFLRDFEEVV